MLHPILADPLKRIRHGFYTRKGGVSSGIYESLNGGPGSDDTPVAVTENRARIAADLGAESLITVSQVHSDICLPVTGPWPSAAPRADAMVTSTPGLALAALAADCAPVLFADSEAGVIGAAHAGWKGALGGVLEATLSAMAKLGARQVVAVVGPCISQAAYEVGPEFFDRFLEDDPDNQRFFAQGQGDRLQFDLPGFVLHRLRTAGADASWTGHCTYGDPARFFSFRRATHRAEPDYGRLVSALRL